VTPGRLARCLVAAAVLGAAGCAASRGAGEPAQTPFLWGNLDRVEVVFERDGDDLLRATWELKYDSAPAYHLVGSDYSPAPGLPAPIWAVEQVVVVESHPVAVVGGAAEKWSAAVASAWDELSTAQLGWLVNDWDGSLVVEAPATKAAWQAVMGVTGDDMATVAAITWTEDFGAPPGEAAAVRIVLNPTVMGALDDADAQAVLTHEAVHAATFAHRPAVGRAWASEGLADLVAFGEPTPGEACGSLATGGLALPDAAFKSSDPAVYEPAFALARAAVWQIEQHDPENWDVVLADIIDGAEPPAELADWLAAWCG
jgi:hypothetical protein